MLMPGLILTLTLKNTTTEFKSVEMHHEQLEEAIPVERIVFNFKNLSVKDLRRVFVASNSKNDPAKNTENFLAQVIVLYHPGQIKNGLKPVIERHISHIA